MFNEEIMHTLVDRVKFRVTMAKWSVQKQTPRTVVDTLQKLYIQFYLLY